MSDIFVALPPATSDGCVLFGKNSNRPPSEVQEVVYYASKTHDNDSKLQCTFVEIDQVCHTHAVILSKPGWTWGAEMGANEHGVCIGNTAVWTTLCQSGDHVEKLIGVDFVRLGLERSATAKEALDVITKLLAEHGQGGPCFEDHSFGQWTHHNSFLMADRTEAWVLDTAGPFWVAQRIVSGTYNISSCLTIGSEFDASLPDLKDLAQSGGHWKPEDGEFHFANVFGAEFTGLSLSDVQLPSSRLKSGKELLTNATSKGKISLEEMFGILRDEPSSINFSGDIHTVASQVSVMSPSDTNALDIHWFTATPNPSVSVFKPFIFCPDSDTGDVTVSPAIGGEKGRPCLQSSVDRRHALYKMHEKWRELMENKTAIGDKLCKTMRELESSCVQEMLEFAKTSTKSSLGDVGDLFKDVTESEMKFYR
ncbi:secernin-1-like [Gigantopelta aegis]|uniref:secernin-1-like n=1 Tax=Gigantopelta aegis TaxID=1735272 RepID=UPI001B88D812|nr:secernin-1-like [Gigantopelta aegis]